MTSLVLVALVALNLFISWWNCKVVGQIWVEARFIGGFMRLLAWCGAVQAAVGFSSVIMLVLVFGGYATGHLDAEYANAVASLWYLLVVFPAIGTGLIITLHSIITAWRERNLGNMGVAAWNTFATAKNLYDASSAVPEAFNKVTDMFKSGKDDRKAALVMMLVVIALTGGVLITAMLIRHYSRQVEIPQVTSDGLSPMSRSVRSSRRLRPRAAPGQDRASR